LLLMAISVFAIVYGIILITPFAEPEGTGEQVTYERSPWAFRHFVLGAIAIVFYMGIEIGVPATLISYLKPTVGFAAAGYVAGLYWLCMLIGRTIGSFIGGKISSRAMVISVSVLAIVLMGCAMLLGDSIKIVMPTSWAFETAEMPIAALLILLVGLCTSVMWTSIFNMATEGLGKYTAKASGIFMMMVVGGGVLPYIQSIVAAENCLISYIVPTICAAFILYYAIWGSKNVNTDIEV
nr:MFS transporter [Paludibacteraceae bacterium]